MPQNNYDAQKGNVFVLIFIAVILFGALGYTFTKSANKGTGNLTKQQAKIVAQDIINYARLVESAVDRVRRNGCSETEISFENTTVLRYTNPNSPSDQSCHIFNDNGGKLSWKVPSNLSLDENFFSKGEDFGYGTWLYSRDNLRYHGSSTTWGALGTAHLIAFLHFIPLEVCVLINEISGVDNPSGLPPREHNWSGLQEFIGTYHPGISLRTLGDEIDGMPTGCYEGNSATILPNNSYHFYHVVLTR